MWQNYHLDLLYLLCLGRVYTSNTKPVFNASLKSRIDEFVTQNKIEIHSGYKTMFSKKFLILTIFIVIAVQNS